MEYGLILLGIICTIIGIIGCIFPAIPWEIIFSLYWELKSMVLVNTEFGEQ
ncbi:hypothetical protein ES705_28676 [subsurface metagenome]